MVRNRKPRSGPKVYSMYPALHDEVSELLEEDDLYFDFYANDDDLGCTEAYDTNIMGRFTCHNPKCRSSGWTSGRVAITIRMYPEDRYNARVYYQRCRVCKKISQPTLDQTYAERIVYRLKKWNGIQLERPFFAGTRTGPHNSDLCEGCKAGHCTALRSDDI